VVPVENEERRAAGGDEQTDDRAGDEGRLALRDARGAARQGAAAPAHDRVGPDGLRVRRIAGDGLVTAGAIGEARLRGPGHRLHRRGQGGGAGADLAGRAEGLGERLRRREAVRRLARACLLEPSLHRRRQPWRAQPEAGERRGADLEEQIAEGLAREREVPGEDRVGHEA
jgi:hypothetical protein